mgnify:CR=1 FL=1
MNQKRALRQLKEIEKRTPERAYNGEMRLAAEEWDSDWKILISTMMSAQTRDEVTIPTAEGLFKKYKSVKKLSGARAGEIEKLIRRVNYHKTKARNIIGCTKMILEEFNGKIPNSVEELIKLPGVGRKTANVYLSEKGGDNIGVDTHLAYISQKLNWTHNKDPHKIERDLENLFPKIVWGRINSVAVRFGKSYISRREKDKILGEIGKR